MCVCDYMNVYNFLFYFRTVFSVVLSFFPPLPAFLPKLAYAWSLAAKLAVAMDSRRCNLRLIPP